ncbi:efflux transporter outer membrane subunit [Halarcobacter anaerophilus]|uniref:RND transporter n=1 Tax=Halarcobacter anaerophilus TaxID=877500 RepID=A0A4Q0XYC8_9BACT|nr:TolC family protein [Halarcobacter anaerophilus]QDF28464.1 putative fusaric acid resistance efflux pump, outer membrane protein [Halarcobacter anaerophilus]RXJ61309.1 hypothetical protein CRV06_14155 [Halarcobacter anaerophilus]
MKKIIFSLLSVFLFLGCVPNIEKQKVIKDTKIEQEFIEDLNSFQSVNLKLQNNWWRKFEDKQLNSLIENAIKNTPSLKALKQRYAKANSLVKMRKSANLPNIGFGADVSRQRFSENYIFPAPLGGNYYNLYQFGLNLDYEFDFWDKRASLIRASLNEALAQKAYIKVKELSVSTSIAKLYISLNYKNRELEQLQILKKITNEKHHILDKVHKLGLSNRKEINESGSSIEKINQKISDLRIEIEDIKRSIAIISGMMPSQMDKLEKTDIADDYKVFIPKDIHLDILSHRPEIAMQKYLLLSKSAYIKNAKAQFYPNISLNGLLNFTSFPWSSLFNHTSFAPLGAVAFSLPLFDAGKREANLNIKVSDYNEQVQLYNQSVIKAVNEVVNSLRKLELTKSNLKYQDEILKKKNKNLQIEKRIYEIGLNNKISYLNSKLLLQEEILKNISLKDKELNAQIDLIKALGGGYKSERIDVSHN